MSRCQTHIVFFGGGFCKKIFLFLSPCSYAVGKLNSRSQPGKDGRMLRRMASGNWRRFQKIVEIWRRMCVSRVMDVLGDGAEGLQGAHTASCFQSYCWAWKNNIYQSSCFLVNANQHPGKTYQLHVEMHQVQTAIQNLPAGRHCATEYIMHYV